MCSSSNFSRNQLALLRVMNNILVCVVHEFCRHSYLFWCINEYCMYSELLMHILYTLMMHCFSSCQSWCVCVCMGARNVPADPKERKLTCYAYGNSNPEFEYLTLYQFFTKLRTVQCSVRLCDLYETCKNHSSVVH